MTKADDILVSAYRLKQDNPPRVTALSIPIEDREYVLQLERNFYIKSLTWSKPNRKYVVSFDFTDFGLERVQEILNGKDGNQYNEAENIGSG